jgi:ketosteroid isomerase-like protein
MDTAPDAIKRYYTASAAGDIDHLVACFTAEADVTDEGRTYHGAAEIRGWRETLASSFTYTQDITGIEQTGDGEYVVKTHVEGDFPGGVVDLTNRFRVAQGLITRLVI